ncbi:MAG: hypothetical protein LBH50_00880 [Spirochaetaceae bacterium]|jgi:predicted DNA-binding protein YlxM (UPF0122 family)|nr:hypothetical protein [Spirochaetaceae bacterium]
MTNSKRSKANPGEYALRPTNSTIEIPNIVSLKSPLAVIGLSKRSHGALAKAGIESVSAFMALTKSDLSRFKNLGQRSREEVFNCQAALKQAFSAAAKNSACYEQINTPECRHIGTPEVLLPSDSVGSLDISVQTSEFLRSVGIFTIADIIKLNAAKITKLKSKNETAILEALSSVEQIKPVLGAENGDENSAANFKALFQQQMKYRLDILNETFQKIPAHRQAHYLESYFAISQDENIDNLALLPLLQGIKQVKDIPALFEETLNTSVASKLVLFNRFLSLDFILKIQNIFDAVYNDAKYKDSFLILKQRSKDLTLHNIAKECGLTRERIRQIESKSFGVLVLFLNDLPFDILGLFFLETGSGSIMPLSALKEFLAGFVYTDQLIYILKSGRISKKYLYNNDIRAFYKAGEDIDFSLYKYKAPEKKFVLKENHKKILLDIETFLSTKRLKPSAIEDLYNNIDIRVSASTLKKIIQSDNNIVEIEDDAYILKSSITDIKTVADTLLKILGKHFKHFYGYANRRVLFESALTAMPALMDANCFNAEKRIYALTRHLFSKEKYRGYNFTFAEGLHVYEKEPDYSKSNKGVLINLSRQNGGIIHRKECEKFLAQLRIKKNIIINYIHNKKDATFYFYDEKTYILSDSLMLNESDIKKITALLDELFADAHYIIPRNIDSGWFDKLPRLPIGLPWTLLLLQEVIKYRYETGYKPVFSFSGQSPYRIAGAFVRITDNSSLADIIYDYIKSKMGIPYNAKSEKFRRLLREAGFLGKTEWFYNMHNVLNDNRFVFSYDDKTIRIVEKLG